MAGQRIGYVLVNTLDQNEIRQLEGQVLDRVFTDKASGRDTSRPELSELLRFARNGDTIVVHSMTGSPGTSMTCVHSSTLKTTFEPDAEWQSEEIANSMPHPVGGWRTWGLAYPSPSIAEPERAGSGYAEQHRPASLRARCPQPIMIILGQPHTEQWAAVGRAVTGTPSSRILPVPSLPYEAI